MLNRADAQRVQARLADFVKSRPAGGLRLAPLAPTRGRALTRSRRVPGTAHLIVAAEARREYARNLARVAAHRRKRRPPIFSQSREFAGATSRSWIASSSATRCPPRG